jgi:hypothetical protein
MMEPESKELKFQADVQSINGRLYICIPDLVIFFSNHLDTQFATSDFVALLSSTKADSDDVISGPSV